jgi:hypothetical protein
MNKIFYVYIYLDPSKNGEFKYGEYSFSNEPFYVGKGKGQRFKQRSSVSKTESGYLNNKIRKLDKNGLKPIILKIKDELLENEAFLLEKEVIAQIGRLDCKKGPLLNFTDGGEGPAGKILSQESKLKISKSKTGKKIGPHSDETKKKMSLARKGVKFSEEHRRNLSKSRKKRIMSDATKEKMRKSMIGKNKGKIMSQEQKNKLKSIMSGRKASLETRLKISQGMLGHKVSQETINKIVSKRRANHNYGKKKNNNYVAM